MNLRDLVPVFSFAKINIANTWLNFMINIWQCQAIKKGQMRSIRSCDAIVCQALTCLVLWCLMTGLLNLEIASAADNVGAQQADQFEQFISNPPPIADLVYERRKPRTPAEFIRLRWQTNASFLQFTHATNLEAFLNDTNPAKSAYWMEARYNNTYWHKGGGTICVTTNNPAQGSADSSIVLSVVNMNNLFINTVLNFGIERMSPGSIRWVKDTFTARNNEWESSGILSRDELGRAQTLTSTTTNIQTKESAKFVCNYFYDDPLPVSYLPNRIERQVAGAGDAFRQTIIIHSMKLGSKLLPETEFSLQNLMASPYIDHIVTTSNEFQIMYKKGEASPLVTRDPAAAALRRPSYQMAYFLIAICLFFIPFLIFLSSKKGREQNDP